MVHMVNFSTSLGIAISTAVTLTEKLAVEQVSFGITRNILDEFSNAMLNFQKELVHQFHLKSMENILLKGKEIHSVYFTNIILT